MMVGWARMMDETSTSLCLLLEVSLRHPLELT
jgi:hypothetical protein